MGPRPRGRGDAGLTTGTPVLVKLQWGRAQEDAETW